MVEHAVGGDVIGPAGRGGQLVGFVGLVVLFEDLDVSCAGWAVLRAMSAHW